MPIGEVTDEEIAKAFSWSPAVARGRDYFSHGQVLSTTAGESGGKVIIDAEVAGGEPEPYSQHITLKREGPNRLVIRGACTCPMRADCKHVVAAILAWRRDLTRDPFAVPQDLARWLGEVTELAARTPEAGPIGAAQKLLYVLHVDDSGAAVVMPTAIKLDGKGNFTGAAKPLDTHLAHSSNAPKYLRASDLRILRRLSSDRRWQKGDFLLTGAAGAEALKELVHTGRCRWRALNGSVIRPGPKIPARPTWISDPDGGQRLRLEVDGQPHLHILRVTPPWYLDAEAHVAGPLDVGLPGGLVATLLAAPTIPPAIAETVAERLAQAFDNAGVEAPLPRRPEGYGTVRPEPKAIARVRIAELGRRTQVHSGSGVRWNGYGSGYRLENAGIPAVQLLFDYDGTEFEFASPILQVASARNPRMRVARDVEAEKRFAARLQKGGLKRLQAIDGLAPSDEQRAWFSTRADAGAADLADFVLYAAPALEAEGWTVQVDPGVSLELVEPDAGDWDFSIDSPGGGDWFDLTLGVLVDGRRLDVLPALLKLVSQLPEATPQAVDALIKQRRARGAVAVALDDGRLLNLPLNRVAPLLHGVLSVWGSAPPDGGRPRLSRWQPEELANLRDAADQGVGWSGADHLLDLVKELRAWGARKPTPVPASFRGQLRPYQQTGLDWLQMLGRCGFGGLLADDMGLGKTVQTLAHFAVLKETGRWPGPALVVAPTSVLPNWADEAGRLTPGLRVLNLRGKERKAEFERVADADLVLTSYPLLARDREWLSERAWGVVVLDEGQFIRNPVTQTARAAFALKAAQRIVLSGTPVENHLGDVWSLMNFLNPGMLGDAKSFVSRYRTPIETGRDPAARGRLGKLLRPFLLRRTKAEVAGDLPPKTEIAETVDLTPGQADLYEATRLIMHTRVREALADKGLARSAVVVLDALLKLRQVCCDPRLVKSAGVKAQTAGSAKLERLLELLEQLREEDRRVLVFSQFTSMLALVRHELDARSISYVWLTGDTQDRSEPVRRFQSGEAAVFLISLKAGGSGLNLTAADTVILYDPWWNPAVEAQAIDRAHRIGQAQPVFVHRLIARDTIEEKMLALQSRKRDLAAALWEEDASGVGGLTEQDIHDLFAAAPGGDKASSSQRGDTG